MMPRYTVGHGRTPGGSKSVSRSDEDGALPQGQEELYLLHLEEGWPGLVLRGPPTAPLLPPSVACSELCDLCSPYDRRLRGACPCGASVRDCLSSPGHPHRAQGAPVSPGGRQRSLAATAGAGGSRGVSQAFFGISHVSQAGPLPLLLLHLSRLPWGLTSLAVFSTSAAGGEDSIPWLRLHASPAGGGRGFYPWSGS